MWTCSSNSRSRLLQSAIRNRAAQIPDLALKISTIGFGMLAMLVGPLLTAALAFFWGNVVFAGKAQFRQVLSVALYAGVIFSLGILLTWPLMAAKHSVAVSYSLAALVAGDPTSVAYVALSKIGVFYIWEFVVAAIGFLDHLRLCQEQGVLDFALVVGV